MQSHEQTAYLNSTFQVIPIDLISIIFLKSGMLSLFIKCIIDTGDIQIHMKTLILQIFQKYQEYKSIGTHPLIKVGKT